MSADILPFLYGSYFDPQQVDAMGKAYDHARAALHDSGQPAVVQEVLAKRIIAMAMTGERDPDKLCECALRGLGEQAA